MALSKTLHNLFHLLKKGVYLITSSFLLWIIFFNYQRNWIQPIEKGSVYIFCSINPSDYQFQMLPMFQVKTF